MNKEFFKKKAKDFYNKIKNCIVLISKGEFNFQYMMYLWGVLPGIILILFIPKHIDTINSNILSFFICLIVAVYFSWHMLSIRKALKVHPEYRVIKQTKKELYKDKTPEEIEEIKKEKRKESIEKLLLLRGWNSTPNYVLVGCFDLYIILTELQRIFNIINI